MTDRGDAEDILQEVFYELIESYRLMKPVEEVTAWLFRVARNRIIDRFRKKRPEPFSAHVVTAEDGDDLQLEDLLPSADAGPEAAYARNLLFDALDEALDELPPEQSEVFIAHEWMGASFKDLAARNRREREHAALAQALCGVASSPAIAGDLQRLCEAMRAEE